MKLLIERAAALRALGRVANVVERKTTIPILSNVLIVAEEGAVRFVGTNNDIEAQEVEAALVEEAGATTVPTAQFYDAVRSLPQGAQLELTLDDGDPRLRIRAGRARFLLPVLPSADFPVMPTDGFDAKFAIPAATLARVMRQSAFAAGHDEGRPILQCVFAHTLDDGGANRIRFIATDGGRLSWGDAAAPAGCSFGDGIMIPNKAVAALQRAFANAAGEVEVEVGPTKLQVRQAGSTLTCRLLDGAYVDYRRAVPTSHDCAFKVDVDLLMAAARRALIAATDKERGVRLSVEPGKVSVSARANDSAQASDEFDVDYEGEPFVFACSGPNLIEALDHIEADVANLQFIMGPSPLAITRLDQPDGLQLVMPFKV